MGSPTTPTHGKLGAIYRLRPNGFKGDGLNDLTWGTAYNGGTSADFTVVIDSEGGGPAGVDTFKWKKDSDAWTEDVAITGAAQTLSDNQTITFASTTGHTLNDQWTIGNLKDQACQESGDEAQISLSFRRLLNPNVVLTWTDSGGKNLIQVDYTQGWAKFDGNVGQVTVTGNNGYIKTNGIEKIGYLFDWSFVAALDLAEIPRMGQEWKEHLPGQAGGNGGANGYFIGCDSLFDAIGDMIDGTQAYFFLELFNYDPDQDGTGDHFNCWVTFDNINWNAPVNEIVKEGLTFRILGIPSFTANS